MPQHRDPHYRGRGRRSVPPRRKPGHLRTNYTEDDVYQFIQDMNTVRSVWSEEVRKADSKAARRYDYKSAAICTLIPMVLVTVVVVLMAVDGQIPWWMVPVAQSVFLIYFVFLLFIQRSANYDENIDIIIYREADRRGIKYEKGRTPLYVLMNKINADYNSYLWNRNFKWN